MERYNIMWTGGLDSTYTMAVYSRYEIEIQPYYLKHGRRSEKYELSAMEELEKILVSHEGTKAKILPLIVIEETDIPRDRDIEEAYGRLKKEGSLGSQYDWIARYARHHQVEGLYYSPVKPLSDSSKFRACIESNGGILQETNSVGRRVFTIDREKSTDDLKQIFGDFNLSETYDMTKQEEEKALREMGFTDLMEKTWFCHTPVLGHPCGYCHPCETTIEAGQTWRFTKQELKRYEQYKAGRSHLLIRMGSYLDVLFGR